MFDPREFQLALDAIDTCLDRAALDPRLEVGDLDRMASELFARVQVARGNSHRRARHERNYWERREADTAAEIIAEVASVEADSAVEIIAEIARLEHAAHLDPSDQAAATRLAAIHEAIDTIERPGSTGLDVGEAWLRLGVDLDATVAEARLRLASRHAHPSTRDHREGLDIGFHDGLPGGDT